MMIIICNDDDHHYFLGDHPPPFVHPPPCCVNVDQKITTMISFRLPSTMFVILFITVVLRIPVHDGSDNEKSHIKPKGGKHALKQKRQCIWPPGHPRQCEQLFITYLLCNICTI